MSVDKRKAPEHFGTSQLVKRTRPDAVPSSSSVAPIVNRTANNGALIQAVCYNHRVDTDR